MGTGGGSTRHVDDFVLEDHHHEALLLAQLEDNVGKDWYGGDALYRSIGKV